MRIRSVVVGVVAGALVPAMALAFTGIFRSAFTEVAASNPTGIAIGDFDQDESSTVDVATCNAGLGGNELIVLIGFNDGTLSQVGGSIPLNSFPSGLLQGQFDDDPLDDLLIAKANDDAVVFLKGLGDNSFFSEPGPPMGVGHGPVGLASQDIDGDSIVDLVTADEGGDSSPGSVTILTGNNDGTFTLIQQEDPNDPEEVVNSLPTDLGTRAVAIGNIDTDPGVDVLAANSRANNLSVFTSDGNGVFTPRGELPTGAAPQDLKLIDLNGDAKLDLIVAVANDDAVTVQFGNGDRTFGTPTLHRVGTSPARISLGDINDDEILDMVVINARSGDLSVILGTGGGNFGPARTYVADAEPQVLALGDLNNDGLLDAVTATQGSDAGPSVAVLRNRGDGTLHAIEDVRAGNGPSALAVGDVDDDGLADLLVSSDGDKVVVLPGGAGVPYDITVGGRTLGLAAVDLNNDDLPDIAVTDGDNQRVGILLAQGGGRFAAPAFYATAPNPGALTVGDFNNDGRPDVAVSTVGPNRTCQGGPNPGAACSRDDECAPGLCTAPGTASVLLQQSNGTFGPLHDTPVEETPTGIASLDVNCDGKDDLVVANLASSSVSVLQACPSASPCTASAAEGTFALAQTLSDSQVGQNPIALVVADFDRDGTDDLAVSNTVAPQTTPNVHLFRGSCAAPFLTPITAQGGQVHVGELASAMVARDFTGDQIVDLAVLSQTGNSVQLLRGMGDGTMRPSNADVVSRMPIAVAAGDFDGNGGYDAATANSDPSANNVSLLFNCARDPGCDHFGRPPPPGEAALRGDGNDDGLRSAADLVAVGAEVIDGDGFQVEAIGLGDFAASLGADANGDGRVDAQDRRAVARRIFAGA